MKFDDKIFAAGRTTAREKLIELADEDDDVLEYLVGLGADYVIREHDRRTRVASAQASLTPMVYTRRQMEKMAKEDKNIWQRYQVYWEYRLHNGTPIRDANRATILASIEERQKQVVGHNESIVKERAIADQLPNDTITVGEFLTSKLGPRPSSGRRDAQLAAHV